MKKENLLKLAKISKSTGIVGLFIGMFIPFTENMKNGSVVPDSLGDMLLRFSIAGVVIITSLVILKISQKMAKKA